jgi:putative peptidoglycan lipid II flippase
LSRFIAREDQGGAQRVQSNAIEIGLLLTVPASIGLYFAAEPLATAIYLGGKFDAGDVAMTAATLAMLVTGLPAYVLVKVLTPGFFARRDTRTPVWTAAAALTLNIILNLALIPRMGIAGLALASALSAWANCGMLYFLLHRRGHFHLERDLLGRIARIALSAAAMGAAIYFLSPTLHGWFGGNVGERVMSVGLLVGTGAFVYFALAWLTGAIDRNKIAMVTRKPAPQEPAQ